MHDLLVSLSSVGTSSFTVSAMPVFETRQDSPRLGGSQEDSLKAVATLASGKAGVPLVPHPVPASDGR